jgi:hypothetical protein
MWRQPGGGSCMNCSDSRILTTHAGSLPFPNPDSGLAVGDTSQLGKMTARFQNRSHKIRALPDQT